MPLAALAPLTDILALLTTVALTSHFDPLGVGLVAASFVSLRVIGTHTPRINPRLAEDFGLILAGVLVPLVGVALLAGSPAETGRFLAVAPWVAGAVLFGRGASYAVIRTARAHGLVEEPTLIIGAGEVGQEVANTLREHPEYGLVPIGFLDTVEDADLSLPLLGGPYELEPTVREWRVRRVIVAFGITREPEMVEIIRQCDRLPMVEVHLVPRFFELGVSAEGTFKDDLWGIPLVRLRRSALRTAAWRTKRIFDLLLGTTLLLLTAPLFGLAALAVRLSSPGPVFFRQERIGQDGKPFGLLKFRTLRVNSESDVAWSVNGDDRVTWIGRILRRTSVDELPQLLNVLRGQMSLIGPRPERPYFVDRFSSQVERYGDRHRVPVGITGWAQAHGLRGDTSIPERVRFDNYYIEHWSLWRDIVIAVRTAWLILTGRH